LQSIESTGAGKGAASQNNPKARRINDACRALGVGRSTLYKLAAEEKIKLIHILGRTLVPESEIERLAREGT
jgi:excisionase family DNA binding protein